MLTTDDVSRLYRVPARFLRPSGGRGVGLLTLGHPLARKPWIRITVGDVDVTKRCQAADDREGWACCFRVNNAGRYYLDARFHGARGSIEFAREVLTGDVRIWRQHAGFKVQLG